MADCVRSWQRLVLWERSGARGFWPREASKHLLDLLAVFLRSGGLKEPRAQQEMGKQLYL